jgi:uncharacterized protein (DUF1501 family)
MTDRHHTRRDFLARAGIIGCSLAASPLLTPVSFAAGPWDTRLVVIILRGGMDGLDVVRPVGDPAYAALRPQITEGPQAPMLDGFFALHPALSELMPLWQAGELGFAHAVSTPYRDKRSHFDGQDLLEAGTASLSGQRDGWLNRLLQEVPGVTGDTAYAIGTGEMRVLDGPAPASSWAPDARLGLSPQAVRLAEMVMESDPALHAALSEALMLADGPGREKQPHLKGPHNNIARFAAERLRGDARIAAFSLNGWDTHRAQRNAIAVSLRNLSQTILTLKTETGPQVWGRTAVVAMTEFGRTVRENGTGGTDHGTAGVMLMAGGALRGQRVLGDWPGLAEDALYQRRDLMPQRDVRAYAAWLLQGMTGVGRSVLEGTVFPGLDMGADPRLLA